MYKTEKFLVFGTLYQFVGWLDDWLMSNDEMYSVQVEHNSDGTKKVSMHIPEIFKVEGNSNKIIFDITYKDTEQLEVTAKYEDHETIDKVANKLIQAIILRWSKHIEIPNFASIVKDEELAALLESRWVECENSFRANAYLSSIILLGSILEGVLLHKIKNNPEEANRAMSAPKWKGKPKRFSEWKLNDMITVARELGWLDKDIYGASDALRKYRNLIHPREQMRSGIYPDEGTYSISKPVVLAALDDLEKL